MARHDDMPGDPPARAPDPTPRKWSLATRLAMGYAITSFTMLTATALVLYWALATNLEWQDDRFLADQVHVIRMLLTNRSTDEAALRQEAEWEVGARRNAKVYVRVLDRQGQLVMETPGMTGVLPPTAFPFQVAASEEPHRGVNLEAHGDHAFRVMAAAASGIEAATAGHVIQVALDRDHEQALLRTYRWQLLAIASAAMALSSIAGYAIARRGVQPLQQIAMIARRIHATTLNERIAIADWPAELAELAATFNGMLNRLEAAFERLARFAADLAHELRTPINNLRGEVEVTLGKARSTEEYRSVLESLLDDCQRLSRIVDGLLFLARAESPQAMIRREPLDVGGEIGKILEFYEPAAREAGVALTAHASSGVTAEIDRTLLQRGLGNLIENALRHTRHGDRITLTLTAAEPSIDIEVADTGGGIAPEHLPRVFDRFYRVDASRASAAGGLGLGLAIVKSIAELHGGSVRITSTLGLGTSVTMRLARTDSTTTR